MPNTSALNYITDTPLIAGTSEKKEVYKTNLREACKALEIIGKHTSIKAFEKEIDLGDNVVITNKPPKEFE